MGCLAPTDSNGLRLVDRQRLQNGKADQGRHCRYYEIGVVRSAVYSPSSLARASATTRAEQAHQLQGGHDGEHHGVGRLLLPVATKGGVVSVAAGSSLLQEGEQPGVRELVGCQGQVGGTAGTAVSPALGGLQALFHKGTQQLNCLRVVPSSTALAFRCANRGSGSSRVVRMGGRIRVSA